MATIEQSLSSEQAVGSEQSGRSGSSLPSVFSGSVKPKPVRLTAKEIEILDLIAAGYDSAGIAQHLGKSLFTIKTQRHRLRVKLGLNGHSKHEFYRWLAANGWDLPSYMQASPEYWAVTVQ